jgi:hypothetical protein
MYFQRALSKDEAGGRKVSFLNPIPWDFIYHVTMDRPWSAAHHLAPGIGIREGRQCSRMG